MYTYDVKTFTRGDKTYLYKATYNSGLIVLSKAEGSCRWERCWSELWQFLGGYVEHS